MEKEERKAITAKYINIILAVIIILQAGLVTYRFVFDKESVNCDEPWSFGLSNSYYKPFLFGNEDKDTYVKSVDDANMYKWLDGSVFTEYLTVQDNERFSYGSVWYNQAHDVHPPFFYVILHTICSLFPNTYTRWYAYIINLASMIIGQIFLYKAARLICRSEKLGILACFMWGFSYGFTNMNIYLRMYSLLVMLSIMFIYYNARIYYNETNTRSDLIKLAAVTFLGSLTQHLFLVSAFAVAACFCFYFLFRKKFKLLFAYAFSVAGAVGLSMAVFPASFTHIFVTEIFHTKMPFINTLRFCVGNLLNSICGGYVTHWATSTHAYVVAAVVLLIGLAVPIAFLCRKKEWFRRLTGKILSGAKYFIKNIDFMFLFMFIGCAFTVVVVAYMVNVYMMGGQVDRYLAAITPWSVICMVLAAEYILKLIKPAARYSNAVIAVLVCASVVCSNIFSEKRYLFERNIEGAGGLETTVTDNSEYIILFGYPDNMVCYAELLLGCDKALFAYLDDYETYSERISVPDPGENFYIVIDMTYLGMIEGPDESLEDTVIKSFEDDIFPGYKLQFYSSDVVLESTIHNYKLVPDSDSGYVSDI